MELQIPALIIICVLFNIYGITTAVSFWDKAREWSFLWSVIVIMNTFTIILSIYNIWQYGL